MSLVNKVLLDGNIGADPEIRYTPDGKAVATMRVATNETYNDKASGERKTVTEWHRVVFFEKQAETIKEYAKKGTAIKIEGRLRTRKWEKGDQTHYTTEVVAEDFRFGPKKADDSTESDDASEAGTAQSDHDSQVPMPDEIPA